MLARAAKGGQWFERLAGENESEGFERERAQGNLREKETVREIARSKKEEGKEGQGTKKELGPMWHTF